MKSKRPGVSGVSRRTRKTAKQLAKQVHSLLVEEIGSLESKKFVAKKKSAKKKIAKKIAEKKTFARRFDMK